MVRELPWIMNPNDSKNKIKLTIFLPNLEAGGAERVTLNLLSALDKGIFEPTLLIGEKRGEFFNKIEKDIIIHDLETTSSSKLIFKIATYLKKEKPDIFVSVFTRFTILSILASIISRSKTRIIIIEHASSSYFYLIVHNYFLSLFSFFVLPFLIKIFYRKASAIICVSEGIANDLLRVVNLPNLIKIVYNPIINDQIYSLCQEPVQHDWFLDKKYPVIIAAGRLTKAKDYPNLLMAFKLVVQNKPAHLVILGEGEERKKLEDLTKKLEISENIAFLGFQKNPYKYMAKSSVFVLSSLREGIPTVIIEAMACGVPVVSTDCASGLREIIENRENGFLVPVSDPQKLADAILILLKTPKLREELSKEAQKKLTPFLINNSTKKYEKIFTEVVSSNK